MEWREKRTRERGSQVKGPFQGKLCLRVVPSGDRPARLWYIHSPRAGDRWLPPPQESYRCTPNLGRQK